MRRFLVLLSVLLMASHPLCAEVLDKILVVVNDEVITQRELDRVLLPIYNQYKSIYGEEELAVKIDEARKKILQQMIVDKLILSKAKREAIGVQESEINEEVARLKKQFASEDEFKAALKQQGMTLNDVEKGYREKIMVKKLIDMKIRSRIKISPIEIENFYNEHLEEFKAPLRVRAKSILLKIKPDRDREATLAFAEQILRRLKEGSDFAEVARLYSDGPYASSGGDMGYLKKGDMIDLIDELIFSLQAGEISDILETNLGYHIFKVEERKASEIQDFNEAKGRIEEILYVKKFQEKFNVWLEELKNNAYIAIK